MQGAARRTGGVPFPNRAAIREREARKAASGDDLKLLQSAGSRRVIFLSARYLSAPALIMGFRICSSAWYQSDEKFHFLPSQVCTRDQVEPMWSAQLVDSGASHR